MSCGIARFCSEEMYRYTDVGPNLSTADYIHWHMARVEHHKEGTPCNTWSYKSYIILPQINDVQYYTQAKPQLKNKRRMTTRSSSLIKVCIGSRAPQCTTVLQNGQDITLEPSSNEHTRQDFLKITCEDAAQKSDWNQMSLPIYKGQQTHSAQFSNS